MATALLGHLRGYYTVAMAALLFIIYSPVHVYDSEPKNVTKDCCINLVNQDLLTFSITIIITITYY